MNIKTLILFSFLILFLSCEENKNDPIEQIDCNALIFEDKELTEESKDFYMYENAETVIFKDSVNNEYIAQVEFSEEEELFEESFECDANIEQQISFNRRTKRVELAFPADSILSVKFILRTEFERNETEFIETNLIDELVIWDKRIFPGNTGGGGKQTYATSVRQSNYQLDEINENFQHYDDFELFGNSFGKVFKTINITPFYISKELGIVMIKDLTGKTLIFDRIE